jgi:predicted aspartyl protease
MPLPTSTARYAAPLAAALLGSSLLATTGHSAPETAKPAQSIPTGVTLLSGSKSPDGDFRVTTEFRLSQNTILLEAQPEGASSVASFVVDSGAPMTIAPQLAQEVDLETLATIGLLGPEGGHLSVPVTRIPTLNIAGLAFSDVGAVVDWVEPPNPLACLSNAGLMGASLLQTAIWQIDFQSNEIIITNSLSELPGLAKAIKIPFKRADAAGSPRISVGVSDSEDVSLLLDLGFNGSIAIPIATLEKAGDRVADSAPTEEGQSSSTVFGQKSSTASIATLRELRIGDLRLKDFPVVTGTAVSDFHVGIDFLRHFRVTVDWLNDDLYLEPRDTTAALYPNFATFGFKPQLRDGQLIIGAIWRGSAADKAGMKLGDQLVKLDSHDTKSADFSTLCAISDVVGLFGTNKAPVSVTWLSGGKEKTSDIAKTPLLP